MKIDVTVPPATSTGASTAPGPTPPCSLERATDDRTTETLAQSEEIILRLSRTIERGRVLLSRSRALAAMVDARLAARRKEQSNGNP